jgi:hypothetical protein
MNIDTSHAVVHGFACSIFRRHLSSKRGPLAGTFKTLYTTGGPGNGIPLPVGDGDYGIIEGGLNMNDTFRYVLFFPAATPSW